METQVVAVVAAAVRATKTMVVTAMVGAQTTINNQIKVAAGTATETTTVTATMAKTTTMAMAAAAQRWWVAVAVGGSGNRKAGLLTLS
jgi:hypothetical protein